MESYRYDLIDVGRQAISAQFGTKLNEYKAAFEKGDADGAATLEATCLAIIVSRQPQSERLWVGQLHAGHTCLVCALMSV